MDKVSVTMKVFFEDPFWIGILERIDNGKLSVCKVTFGTEPKDYDVMGYVLRYYYMLRFSPTVGTAAKSNESINPKRMQRSINKQLLHAGIGTKSKEALKLQHEQNKLERKYLTREQKERNEERLYALKQLRRKEKHRGR